MKQLSGLDAIFLYLEKPEMPMHVGALHLFELPPGYRGRFLTALRRHIAARLPVAPPLRRRLWWMPLNLANPAWVDADPDLREHIVEVKVRKGATLADLQAKVGELHPELLPRDRPLWKFHVFEGLAPGPGGERRVALYTKLHHAAVDGQAAVALANAILDLTPEPRAVEARASRRPRAYRLEMVEMLRGVLGNQAQKVAQIVRELPSTVSTVGGAAGRAIGRSALLAGGKASGNVTLAPRTALNASVTTGRAFATATLPLAELRDIGRAHGATLNDMVLLLCSTALRRHFAARKALPRQSLVAAVPISLRAQGDTTAENQASMSLVSLGTQVADLRERLKHVQRATAAMKSTMGSLRSVLPTDFPSLGVPWLMEAAATLYGKVRVADRVPQFANLVISNVPGPPQPLYMAGARMLTNHPASIVVHGIALNITVQSYDGHLDFGLMADAQAMPDVADLAQALQVAMDDLRAMAAEDEAATPGAAALVGQATRRLTRAVGGAVGAAVGTAVGTAVGGAVSRGMSRAVGSRLGPMARAATADVAATVAGTLAGRAAARLVDEVTSGVVATAGRRKPRVADATAETAAAAAAAATAEAAASPSSRRRGRSGAG
ncbi:MAG: wax ester/triacylglycerol synthase family O-acyltransferase [Pseudomonadota bacterium]|jgi:WS/DGAT/MGAT family acyltransferase